MSRPFRSREYRPPSLQGGLRRDKKTGMVCVSRSHKTYEDQLGNKLIAYMPGTRTTNIAQHPCIQEYLKDKWEIHVALPNGSRINRSFVFVTPYHRNDHTSTTPPHIATDDYKDDGLHGNLNQIIPNESGKYVDGYSFSGITTKVYPCTNALLHLLNIVNARLGTDFNSILINKYEANDSIGWHGDDTSQLSSTDIATLSIGNLRDFNVRLNPRIAAGEKKKRAKNKNYESPFFKSNKRIEMVHGAMIVMRGKNFQQTYQHSVNNAPNASTDRVSFTFRTFKFKTE